jgi:hypothetical protein
MKIGVLGTGMVGLTLATRLVQRGHHVTMGSRTPENPSAARWARENGVNAAQATFADAALDSELVFLCTKGEATLEVVRTVGPDAFGEKVVIDVTNPLDFSRGTPPPLLIGNTDSLAEHVQKALPYAKVVKTLNLVHYEVMVDPFLAGDPTMLLCGNDAAAKKLVTFLLRDLGWNHLLDLGDIKQARALEMLAPVWMSLRHVMGHPHFGFKIVTQ